MKMENILNLTVKTLKELGYRSIRLIKVRKRYAIILADMDVIRVSWDRRNVYVTVLTINPYRAQIIWRSITVEKK